MRLVSAYRYAPFIHSVQQTLANKRNAANVEAGKKVEAGHISGLSRAKAACHGLHLFLKHVQLLLLTIPLLLSKDFQDIINKINTL